MIHPPELLITAYHEAGHAIVAVHYRMPVTSVSIIANKKTLGRIIRHPLRPLRTERALRREFHFALAGETAVRWLSIKHATTGTKSDYEVAEAVLHRLSAEKNERDGWNVLLRAEVRNLIAHYEHALKPLAEVLMKRKVLAGKEVRRIVRNAPRQRGIDWAALRGDDEEFEWPDD